MSNQWKITKFNAAGAVTSGLSHLKNGIKLRIVLHVGQNLLKQSNIMARRVFRIMAVLMLTIGLWLMVGFICLVLGVAVIATALPFHILSVAAGKVKNKMKG